MYRVFTEAPVDAEPGRDVIVQISDDMSDMDIAKELKEKGLVENAKLFFVQLKVSAYSGRLHSGVYTLNTSMAARDMMVIICNLCFSKKKREAKMLHTQDHCRKNEWRSC